MSIRRFASPSVGSPTHRARGVSRVHGCSLNHSSRWRKPHEIPPSPQASLAQCAIVRVMAAEYEHGLALVTMALERSEKLGLTVAVPQCLFWKALAEIGLRRMEQAKASAERLHGLVVDPYTEIIDLQLKLRLLLALGGPCEWNLYERDFPSQLQRVSVGDFYGMVGLGLTAAGMPEAPRFLELARSLSSSAEARYFVEFADLIAAFHGEEPDAKNRASSLARAAHDDGMADAWVTAYRLCPEVLSSVANSRRLAYLADSHRASERHNTR